jgi:hypothetical protein
MAVYSPISGTVLPTQPGQLQSGPNMLGYFPSGGTSSTNTALAASGLPNYGVQNTSVTPILGADGRYYNPATGAVWSGTLPGGGLVQNGTLQKNTSPNNPSGINPNNPQQVYQPVNITKTPDVAAGEQDLMAQFTTSANDALKDFDQYLSSFQSQLSGALPKIAAATNAQPTINALTAAQQQYAGALGTNAANLTQSVNQANQTQQGLVTQAEAVLPQYQAAEQAIAGQELGAVQADVSRYKLGSGTPTSMGATEQDILQQGVQNVELPLNEAMLQQQENIIQNFASPVAAQIASRNSALYGSQLPALAGAGYSSAQGTANQISALQQQVAGMSLQDAQAFLTAANVPTQIQQQILSGQIGQLGGLSNVEQGATYQGLQDVLGGQVSQPQSYSFSSGGLGSPTRYAPSGQPANAPVQVGPQQGTGTGGPIASTTTTAGAPTGLPSDAYLNPSNQLYYSPSTGQSYFPDGSPANAGQTPNAWTYNPSTGATPLSSQTLTAPGGLSIQALAGLSPEQIQLISQGGGLQALMTALQGGGGTPDQNLQAWLQSLAANAAAGGGAYSTTGGDAASMLGGGAEGVDVAG